MRRLLPHGVAGQMAVALVASLVLIHGLFFVSFMLTDKSGADVPGHLHRVTAAVWVLDALSPEPRAAALETLNSKDPDLRLRLSDAEPQGFDWSMRRLPEALVEGLGKNLRIGVAPTAEPFELEQIVFRLNDGSFVVAEGPLRARPLFNGPGAVTVLFLAVSLAVLGGWSARELVRPLQRLAGAVERFGSDTTEPEDLPEEGPVEVRRVASALNRMQHRINQLMENRVRMLAAIGHDLRTPITRLRLRADFVQEAALRDSFIADLDHMDALLQGGLTYLREGRSGETTVSLDLASLLTTVSDQIADLGHAMPLDGGDSPIPLEGRPTELLRLFSNLADNAVKYAGGGEIRVHRANGMARVEVADKGPGIPDSQKEAMQEPFVIGDIARNKDRADGFGLGLAICRSIVQGHGGALALLDTPGGGLTVRVDLPLKG